MTLSISSGFDSGNIRVWAVHRDTADLEIIRDRDSDFYQWFHFRVSGAAGHRITLRILNCGGSAYPQDRKSTRLNSSTNAHLVCRLLLEKKKKQKTKPQQHKKQN